MNQEQEATGPGIVVRSPSLQILYITGERWPCSISWMQRAEQRAVAAPLHQHCQDIIETLQARLGSNNWGQFQQYRRMGNSTHSILLKGFGLPDSRGLPYYRIVILLSPHTHVPMPEISGRESLEKISESSHLAADSPAAIGM